jgi:hypothetical protein
MNRILPLALLMGGIVLKVNGGVDITPASGVLTNADSPATNTASSNRAHPDAWPVYPGAQPIGSSDSIANTNTIVILDNTNAPVPVPPQKAAAPSAPGSADPDPDTIQSSPGLQGTGAAKGPI